MKTGRRAKKNKPEKPVDHKIQAKMNRIRPPRAWWANLARAAGGNPLIQLDQEIAEGNRIVGAVDVDIAEGNPALNLFINVVDDE